MSRDDAAFAPVTPGEILRDEFLSGFDLDEPRLAEATGIELDHLLAIVQDRAAITAADALRFGLLFGNSPEFWMNLQTHYDLRLARQALRPDEAARIATHRVA